VLRHQPSTAQVCRDCGHVFAPPERRELRQVEGELQEIAVTKRREQGKATDLEALRELAQQRGYKRGWAERVYQARLSVTEWLAQAADMAYESAGCLRIQRPRA
jgi:NMD protein affecting ribosome stability and mRNA decay